jgi:hypothetical protein
MNATATANDAALARLAATVRQTLADVHDHTTDPAAAETTIMTAAQQWVTEGYVINAAPCPGTTVGRWYAPHGWSEGFDPTPEDPGPYTVGEHVTCGYCDASVPVARVKTTQRETGTQYIAWLAQH